MKKPVRVLVAGFATAGILAGIQIYSASPVNWFPSLIGFVISALSAAALINVRWLGGNGLYRAAVIGSSLIVLGVLVGVLMGGGPVVPSSLVAGISLVGIGAVIMWPVTVVGIFIYLIADVLVVRIR